MNCARCGHDLSLHGRRGCGSCRHGRYGGLAAAVDALRLAVYAGVPKSDHKALVERAMETKSCTCKRFLKRPPKETPTP